MPSSFAITEEQFLEIEAAFASSSENCQYFAPAHPKRTVC